jgi:hypothetical protein
MANVTKPPKYTWASWLAGNKQGSIHFAVGTTNLHYCSEVRHSQPLGHNAAHDSSIHAFCAALQYGSLQRISWESTENSSTKMATSPSSTSVRRRSWLRNTSTGAQCATVSCSQPAASRRPKLEVVAADFTIKEGRITAGTSTAVPSRRTIRRSTARTCPWFTCVTTAYTSASLSSSSSLSRCHLGLSVSRSLVTVWFHVSLPPLHLYCLSAPAPRAAAPCFSPPAHVRSLVHGNPVVGSVILHRRATRPLSDSE